MTVKEIHKKAGSLSDYVWYIFLVFCWYFMDNIYTSMQPMVPGSSIETLLLWVYRIAIVPFLLAGVLGGLLEQRRSQEITSGSAFFDGARTYYWRIMGANLLAIIFILVITSIALVL